MTEKLSDIQSKLRLGEISCVSLVEFYLQNIEKNKHLNAFLEVFELEARNKAIEVDAKIKNNTAGRLAGLVLGIKDNLCYTGHKVSASSKILEGYEAVYTATAVQRLLDEDAIIIGRLNCDEFAMGASNENSAYGPVLNFQDNTRVPGGSSGGSAVAVQANMCHASLGSDTGGSIRQPASFCGLWGYKPSYGCISRHGLLAYASSFDQIGPLTKSIEDLNLIMDVLSGPDQFDATAFQAKIAFGELQSVLSPKRFAVIKECIENEGVDPEIKAHTMQAIAMLQEQGHTVEMVDFPLLDALVPAYYVLTTAEASSNLARYSGLLFGYRSPNAQDLNSTFVKSRSEGFGPEVKRRIMLGTFVLSSNHYDAYYTKAQKVRRLIQQKTEEIFATADFILLPTTSTPAFKLGEKANNPIAMYLADLFTVHANLAGNPAVSIPTGTHTNHMPYGLQLMAPMKKDKELLDIAAYLYHLKP